MTALVGINQRGVKNNIVARGGATIGSEEMAAQ